MHGTARSMPHSTLHTTTPHTATVYMFAALLALMAIAQPAYAEISVIEPVVTTLQNNAVFALGEMQPAETLELVVSRRTGEPGTEWTHISAPSLPTGWAVDSVEEEPATLILKLKTSARLEPNTYNLRITLSSATAHVAPERADLRIQVKRGLIDLAIGELSQTATVHQPVSYTLTANNKSIAVHRLRISSGLSAAWFMPVTIELKPMQTLTETLTITPLGDGMRGFKFLADSELHGERVAEFDAALDVKPTLASKYSAGLSGFPFFTFALAPFQALVSLLGLVLP